MTKHVKIPDGLYENAVEVMEENGFATFTEYTRHAVRVHTRELKQRDDNSSESDN